MDPLRWSWRDYLLFPLQEATPNTRSQMGNFPTQKAIPVITILKLAHDFSSQQPNYHKHKNTEPLWLYPHKKLKYH